MATTTLNTAATKKTTMKPAGKKTTTAKSKQGDVTVTPEQHVETVKNFMSSCLRVRYTKSGMPRSKSVSRQAIKRLADEAGGDPSSFSGSKRLLKGGKDSHPLIRAINEWETEVDRLRNRWTFPLAADASADTDTLQKASAERLIRVDDVEDFEAILADCIKKGRQLSKQFHDEYATIINYEKKRLGNEFSPNDYPTPEGVYRSALNEDGTLTEHTMLRISDRAYSEVTASVRLPQKVLERMTVQAAELINQTVEVIVADRTKTISEAFITLANRLVDRVQVRPPHGHPLRQALSPEVEAEVMSSRTDDAGKKWLLLKWKDKARGPRATRDQEFGPYSEEEYQALRPEVMNETKSLHSSVIDNLLEQLEVFNAVKNKMGVYGECMDQILDAVRATINKATGNTTKKTEAIYANVKDSAFFRNTLQEELNGAVEAMSALASEARTVRRKVHGNIAMQVAQASLKKQKE